MVLFVSSFSKKWWFLPYIRQGNAKNRL